MPHLPEDGAGRPTKYQKSFAAQAYKLCLLGATQQELADFFEVHKDTIQEWMKIHPEFKKAIKQAGAVADSEVSRSLFKRACGFQHKRGKYSFYFPPDPGAAIFWLKNRQRGKWTNNPVPDVEDRDILSDPDPDV
jgi:hypothetical protein